MFTWYVFRWFILVLLISIYAILWNSQWKSTKNLREVDSSLPPEVDASAFTRSMDGQIRHTHKWQCMIMVATTIDLACFDRGPYMEAALICCFLAIGHYYLWKKIKI